MKVEVCDMLGVSCVVCVHLILSTDRVTKSQVFEFYFKHLLIFRLLKSNHECMRATMSAPACGFERHGNIQVPVEVEKIEYVDKIVEREVEDVTETTVTVIFGLDPKSDNLSPNP